MATTKKRATKSNATPVAAPLETMADIGRKGGEATLRKKGSAFYRKIAKMRKTHAGGRPKGRKNSK